MSTYLSPLRVYYRQQPHLVAIVLAFAVLGIDFGTGKYIQFPIAYAIPIGLAAWALKKNMAYGMAVTMPLIRLLFYYEWNHGPSVQLHVINAAIRILALSFYAYLIDRIAWQKRALEKRVRVLEGILPICANCKKIRNPAGEYEQIEQYVSDRTDAKFSHGLCPDCTKKLYPEIYDDIR